jgi:TPR repeat protein
MHHSRKARSSRFNGLTCAGGLTILLAHVSASPQAAQRPEDVQRALASARAQAESGDVVAQFSLGCLLYYGGGEIDEALAWLERAATQDYAPAEFHLGQAADVGAGAPPDAAAAFRWYRRSADRGFAPAERAVGDAYRVGRGVRPDLAEAARWYTRAARSGDLRAQYHIGQLYFDGEGVARDYVWAYVWFDRAAEQTPLDDNRRALIELRNIAGGRMSAEQLATARTLLQE